MKRFFFILGINLVVFLCMLLVIEFGASLVFFNEQANTDDLKNKLQQLNDSDKTDRFPFVGRFIPHPLFGFTNNPELEYMNNYGFAFPEDYPYVRKNQKEIVVGLYGGSVAEQSQYFVNEALNTHPKLEPVRKCGFNFKLINLALGAIKEPQTLHIFLHSQSWIDVAIKLDGRNDLFADPGPHIPVDFPPLTQPLYQLNRVKVQAIEEVLIFRKIAYGFYELMTDFPLLEKSTIFLKLADNIEKLVAKKAKATNEILSSVPVRIIPEDNEGRVDLLLAKYVEYSQAMHTLTKASGKLNFFFLQPSQYTKKAKIMSEEEKAIAMTRDPDLDRRYRLAAAYHAKAYQQMKTAGLNVTDLTEIFVDNPELLFKDDCCHLNKKGYALMAAKMMEPIIPGLLKKYRCK